MVLFTNYVSEKEDQVVIRTVAVKPMCGKKSKE
jgi:hypothetical protein